MFWRADINPETGPFKVFLARGEFVDESRHGRKVPFKIYYPSDHGLSKMPVIIWSHGFGGNRDGAGFIARYVASHGYILAHLTHQGTDSSLWEGKPGHPWDILREIDVPRATTLNRFKDVPFALDQLVRWAQDNPDPGRFMDFEMLGMSGHSFGALTTQVMAGQIVPDEEQKLVSFRDLRFKAGIPYSPVPISKFTGTTAEEIYDPIAIPLFHMTGTEDASPLENFGYEERLIVYNNTFHADKYALILAGGDHMVYNGTRGKLGDNPLRGRHEEIIRITSLAFWDAYLRGDRAATGWLVGGAGAYLGADAVMTSEKKK